jgi:hypothetical protein
MIMSDIDNPIRTFTPDELDAVRSEVFMAINGCDGLVLHNDMLGGSVAINGQGRDVDWLALCYQRDKCPADHLVMPIDWVKGGSDEGATDNTWASWKKQIQPGLFANMIIVTDYKTWKGFAQATLISQYVRERFGLLDRSARVAIHRFIMDHACEPYQAEIGTVRGEM